MDKSIESIWKEGFAKESNITAPKINDLYNRKSANIVDKLQEMFAVNIKAIIGGSVFILILMSMIGAPFLGLYMCLLVIPLIVIAKKELTKSFQLSKGVSSYEYLTNFNSWLQSSIKTYGQYYQYAYPLLFIGMVTQAIVSNAGQRMMAFIVERVPTEYILFGVPYYFWLPIVLITLLLVKYADAIYKFDLNLVYGKQFKRLEELIADMEELRK